jgi:hypothetical protein
VVWVVGSSLAHPATLNAEAEIAEAKLSSQQLEARLEEWNPDQRIIDGRTMMVVIDLKDSLAALDRQIRVVEVQPRSANGNRQILRLNLSRGDDRLTDEEVRLWRKRVRLMDMLVKVTINRSTRIEL